MGNDMPIYDSNVVLDYETASKLGSVSVAGLKITLSDPEPNALQGLRNALASTNISVDNKGSGTYEVDFKGLDTATQVENLTATYYVLAGQTP